MNTSTGASLLLAISATAASYVALMAYFSWLAGVN